MCSRTTQRVLVGSFMKGISEPLLALNKNVIVLLTLLKQRNVNDLQKNEFTSCQKGHAYHWHDIFSSILAYLASFASSWMAKGILIGKSE